MGLQECYKHIGRSGTIRKTSPHSISRFSLDVSVAGVPWWQCKTGNDMCCVSSKQVIFHNSVHSIYEFMTCGWASKCIQTMLSTCLCGHCSCRNETLSTLRFAQRAKAIQNKAVINEEEANDVNLLREQIRQLKVNCHHCHSFHDIASYTFEFVGLLWKECYLYYAAIHLRVFSFAGWANKDEIKQHFKPNHWKWMEWMECPPEL